MSSSTLSSLNAQRTTVLAGMDGARFTNCGIGGENSQVEKGIR